ncbi:MAG: tRNA dihydrouridine(20/20a) synthase DusA [Alphaproteobacteria bacterium]|nr:tRNA dihydrouridine(20/20a) synthase DusA [Alphaproteobacteria bacterium]
MMSPNEPDRRLSVAPMMEWTDRHCRVFLRAITKRTLLYTEMVHTGAILRGDAGRHLGHDPVEHPLALQLGGSDPADLAAAARMGRDYGYDEINLNVGCPSERVSAGRFGACLMAEPELVADCVAAMAEAVDIPVTVKSRIGIDERDSYEELAAFIEAVAARGCRTFIIHARKAWLSGLSPKQNREVPPLRYEFVRRIKADFPALEIILNGGVDSLTAAAEHLSALDGVMIGRVAYNDPWILRDSDARIFAGQAGPESRHAVIDSLLPYIEAQCGAGVPLQRMTRHMIGLFNGLPGARAWRRHLSENARRAGAGPEVLRAAAALVSPDREAA